MTLSELDTLRLQQEKAKLCDELAALKAKIAKAKKELTRQSHWPIEPQERIDAALKALNE